MNCYDTKNLITNVPKILRLMKPLSQETSLYNLDMFVDIEQELHE